jgi:hypothetical protein
VSQIFVSYRRDDDAYAAAGIAAGLARRFGAGGVFMDSRSMPAGTVYPKAIRRALRRCDVLVAVIGPAWLGLANGSGRRIDDPADWVRLELRTAFERGIPVVPTLLDGAVLPAVGELPGDIRQLALSQFWHVRGQSFEADVDALATQVGGSEDRSAAGGWTQVNTANGNGVVYASQGGTQHIVNEVRR